MSNRYATVSRVGSISLAEADSTDRLDPIESLVIPLVILVIADERFIADDDGPSSFAYGSSSFLLLDCLVRSTVLVVG